MEWKQIQRIKWNYAKFVMFLEDDDVAFESKRDSKIGKFGLKRRRSNGISGKEMLKLHEFEDS